MTYTSTRGDGRKITAGEAILKGIAGDGGLYVPESIPAIDFDLRELPTMSYQTLAYEILKLYLTDYTEDELFYCIRNAYSDKFDTELIAPLKNASGTNFLELFHGRTLAFKDMALSILPYLLKTAASKYGQEKTTVILTATSGDTGKAALEGFADVDGVKIIVFYPENGVSAIQKRQMTTQEGANTYAVGVKGNFDDTQTEVKRIFTDSGIRNELEEHGFVFSSANSINIGRLLPQIVYYFYAYGQMAAGKRISIGDKLNFTVPTGNFGNILAGFFAREMGLPVGMLICASNENNVLYDMFRTGVYDINREFTVTISPSMDILISSNYERLVYYATQCAQTTQRLMEQLNTEGRYELRAEMKGFNGQYATHQETCGAIRDAYEKGYIIDPHTAVAYAAYQKYINETGDDTENVILATASPFKFASDVCHAIDPKYDGGDLFAMMEALAEFNKSDIPWQIRDIAKKEERHRMICRRDEMRQVVRDILL